MRFERIDQLRGFAALAVVVCHMAVSAWNGAPNLGERPFALLGQILGFGYLGVPLFFVISGFCIHLPQARALAAAARRGSDADGADAPAVASGGWSGAAAAGLDWRRFFARRLWRLYPPYLAALVVAAVLALLSTGRLGVGAARLLAEAALVHTLHPATFDGLNPPAWTLAVEAQLYLAYPIVLALIVKYRPWRALAAIAAVTMAYRLWLNFEPFGPRFGGLAWEVFLARWLEWALGALVAAWAVGSVELPRALKSPWMAALVLGLGILLEWHTWHWGLYALKEPLYGVGFALLLCAALDGERGRAGQIRVSRIGRWLGGVGVYSYSLYLLHRPIQLAFEPLARWLAVQPLIVRHAIPSSLLLMAATTPLVMWSGRLLFRWCEAPCIAIAHRAGQAAHSVPRATAGTGALRRAAGR